MAAELGWDFDAIAELTLPQLRCLLQRGERDPAARRRELDAQARRALERFRAGEMDI